MPNIKGVKKQMRKLILAIFAAMLLFSVSANAAFDTATFNRDPENAVLVEGLIPLSSDACAVFHWDLVSDVDFNNFVVRSSSNNPKFNYDTNTRNSWITHCTISDGDWVKVVVYRVDGNADGYVMSNYPDINAIVNPGTMVQAGNYFAYMVMVAFGTLVGLIIITIVLIFVLKHFGLKFKFK